MDSQSIEGIAVSKVCLFLYRSKQILPYINIQDKMPTWDGSILLYRREGKKVEDILGQLNVQVKGKKAEEWLEQSNIHYSIEYKHLRNFRIIPTVFFVVVMDNIGWKTSLFMTTFTPKEISDMLEKCKDKEPEQKKTICLQKVTSTFQPNESDKLFEKLKEFNNICARQQRAHMNMQNVDQILMPINPRFLSVFGKFIDDSDIPSERVCSVSRYLKGIIDIFLKNVIIGHLNDSIEYKKISIEQKIKYITDWDEEIGNKFSEVFKFGNKVEDIFADISETEVNQIIYIAIHIVEDLFVKYFSNPNHRFGTENILFYFSILPLENRIYILEKLKDKEQNLMVIDKLSLAYVKIGKYDKAFELLKEEKENGRINVSFYEYQCDSIWCIMQKLESVQDMNVDKLGKSEIITGVLSGSKVVIGFPSNNNMFDVKRAYDAFENGFKELYDSYPEFVKLFLYLMRTDLREYEGM